MQCHKNLDEQIKKLNKKIDSMDERIGTDTIISFCASLWFAIVLSNAASITMELIT